MARKRSSGISSEAAVAKALRRKQEAEAALVTLRARLEKTALYAQVSALEEEVADIDAKVKEFVLGHYEPGDGYEDEYVKVTKVQSHQRRWNVERLQELVKPRMFRSIVTVTVAPAKIDEMVREGKLDLDEIADAYEDFPSSPYVRVTAKSPDAADAAASLAEKLG